MKRASLAIVAMSVGCLLAAGTAVFAQQKQPSIVPAGGVAKVYKEPMKGTAVFQVLKPVIKVVGKEIVTTLTIKNVSYGPVAGLRVDEYWYDKKGEVIGGDTQRVKQLVPPDATVTFELHTLKDPKMDRNSYQFSHVNGQVRAESVKKF
jgi:hypothetical protein